MALIKKYSLISIFISILSIFAMSHNANAIQPVINLNNYELVHHSYAQLISCDFVNMGNTVASDHNYCTGKVSNSGNRAGINSIYTTNTFETKTGDILSFYLLVSMDNGKTESDLLLSNLTNQTLGWNILDWRVVDSGEIKNRLYSTGGYINQQGVNYDLNVDFYEGYQYYRLYEISLISVSNAAKSFGLSSSNSFIFQIDINDAYGAIFRFRLSDYKLYRYSGDEANKEVEEKTQEAVDDSQAAGTGSSSSASQGGANLLSAITGFFNVITSASPTNCRFNAPLNTYFGNERLNVDLCSLDLPSGIGALTSIIAIGILIPFAIHMFNKFIALFRSFQS